MEDFARRLERRNPFAPAAVDEAFAFASQRIVRAPKAISYRPEKLRLAAKLESTAPPSNRYEQDRGIGNDDVEDDVSSDSDEHTSEKGHVESSKPTPIATGEDWDPSCIFDQWNKAFGTDSEPQNSSASVHSGIATGGRNDSSLFGTGDTEIRKRRTGRALRVTEQESVNEEMYEEEDEDLPAQYRQLTAHLQTNSVDFNRKLHAYLASHHATRAALAQYDATTMMGPSARLMAPRRPTGTSKLMPAGSVAAPYIRRSAFTPIDDQRALLNPLWDDRVEHSNHDVSQLSSHKDMFTAATGVPWTSLLRKRPVDASQAHYTISRDVAWLGDTVCKCIQVLEKYSVCGCLYYKHSVDVCTSHVEEHIPKERTVFVGYVCASHTASHTTPTTLNLLRSALPADPGASLPFGDMVLPVVDPNLSRHSGHGLVDYMDLFESHPEYPPSKPLDTSTIYEM